MISIRSKVVPCSFLRRAKSNEFGTTLVRIWYDFVPMADFWEKESKKNVQVDALGGGCSWGCGLWQEGVGVRNFSQACCGGTSKHPKWNGDLVSVRIIRVSRMILIVCYRMPLIHCANNGFVKSV